MRRLLLLFLLLVGLRPSSAQINSQDAAVLQSVTSQWQNEPPSWRASVDACKGPWDGVSCVNGRVTELRLSSMNLKGTLSNDIGQLSELTYLDLSNNRDLGGALTPNIGNLKQLTTLILLGCSFTGPIPQEIGTLRQLTFLALNSNQFTGRIPPSIGLLSNLFWLDLADNQLTGPIPVSSSTSPGLDLLVRTKHFHLNQNKFSGTLDQRLFNANMTLIHILLDNNQITGPIPQSVGLIQSLQILRLDKNQFSGTVPASIGNLLNLNELSLSNNHLTGPLPNLTKLVELNYVDLSNSTFDISPVPSWLTAISSLNTIMMDNVGLTGPIPKQIFTIPQMQQVSLAFNQLNGSLDMSSSLSSQLQIVNLQNNGIISADVAPSYNNTLILLGNPVCSDAAFSNTAFCSSKQLAIQPYSTSLAKCASTSCPSDQSVNPQNCACAYPFQGLMVFRAPLFTDVTDSKPFLQLESSLMITLELSPGSVALSNIQLTTNNYLTLEVKFFPFSGMYFNRSDVLRIGFDLTNQTYSAPAAFGPYYFLASPYTFNGEGGKKSSMSTSAVIGVAVAAAVLLVLLILVALYALRQKKKTQEATERTNPFASWGVGGEDTGAAPQLKGARFFTFDELKKSTDNFSESHEIGSGGYGKVYKGVLTNGQLVAIKRAQQGSMQGAYEFKNEIELLSRVHHKNLVSLVGFCYEQGEQMLVYEYIPNGTLRENLIGRGGMHLDWKKRLRIALGSARGLAYLHELADPPIIHRDVKSTNILLDENINAKVADFGLSKLVSDTQKGHVSTQVKGTLGYLDPEYYMTQQLSEKSDVYSFGVVLLELVTARQPIEKGTYIVREVRTAIDQYDQEYYGLKDLMDPAIRNSAKLVGLRRFVQLAMECVEESAVDRPRMNEVVREIEIILQNDGVPSTNSASSSSATELGIAAGRHPYGEHLPVKDESSGPFDYSSGYAYSTVEPK